MLWSKKGQGGAAILIALVALMIILYVLFLPPAEREALLGEEPIVPGSSGSVGSSLYSATVGTVFLENALPLVHTTPSLVIRTVESGQVMVQRDALTTKNNVFEKVSPDVTFNAQPALSRNAYLSFNVDTKNGGNLIVKMNGDEVFNKDVVSRSVPPIQLNNLREVNNLTFTTSSVGFSFWKTNSYTLSNIKVTADVTDLSGASTKQVFVISEDEFKKMQTARLSFVPICNAPGTVVLSINGAELYAGSPDCGGLNMIDVSVARLLQGENTLSASTRDADIVIDRVQLVTVPKEQQNQIFTFSAQPSVLQHRVILKVSFPDSSLKRGAVFVNGNTITMSAQKDFVTDITQFIQPQNVIQFRALDKEFEIVKFDVVLN